MCMVNGLGRLYDERLFADLVSINGQPARSPVRLALVTLMQAIAGLADR